MSDKDNTKLQEIHDDVLIIKAALKDFNPTAIRVMQCVHTKIIVALIAAIVGVYGYIRTLHPPVIIKPAPMDTVVTNPTTNHTTNP